MEGTRKGRLFLMVGLLLSCGGEDADVGPSELAMIEVQRIGSIDGAGTALSSPTAVFDSDSLVYVLEMSPARLTLFDRDGRWMRDIAGAGEGPGELRRPAYLGRTDGRIWVGDPLGGRVEVFSDDGRWLQSRRSDVPPDSGGARAYPMALLSGERLLFGPGSTSISGVLSGGLTHQTFWMADEQHEVKPAYVRPIPQSDYFQTEIGAGQDIVGGSPIQEAAIVSACRDGSGIMVVERPEANGTPAVFTIRKISSDGTTVYERRVEYDPLPAGRTEMVRRLSEMDMGPEIVQAFADGVDARDFLPPVSAAFCGSDGTIWFSREETSAPTVEWYGLDSEGAWIGRVAIAKEMKLLGGRAEKLWAVEKNELDVPYLVGYRLNRLEE